jgi:tetratricopeptide (TPR) repeat protein
MTSCAIINPDYKISRSNTIPMYGHIQKTDYFKQADEEFIKTAISEFDTREKATLGYAQIAWNHLSKNYNDLAIKRFNQVWLLDSLSADAYFGFAACAELKGKSPQEYISLGKKYDSNHEVELKYNKIMILIYPYYYNNNQKSMEYCNKMLEIDKNNHFALQQRGHLFALKKDYNQAINDFKFAVQIDTLSSASFNDYAYSLEQTGQNQEALIYYEQSALLNPQFLNPLYNSAMLLIKLNENAKALEKINQCIKIDPSISEFKKIKKSLEEKL